MSKPSADPQAETGAGTAQRRLLIALGILVAAGAGVHASAAWMPLFPLDDAYLVQHNVRVLYTGRDPGFAGTPILRSATSFLHLAFVTSLAAFMPTAWAAFVAAWAAILLLVLGCCRLAMRADMPWSVTAALVVIALVGADAGYQLVNGIETGLAMAAVVWALVTFLAPRPSQRWTFPITMGLLPLVRPELGLLAALLLAENAWQGLPGARVRLLVRDASIALAVSAPALLLYWLSTGSPIPSTIGVKQHFFAEGCLPLSFKARQFGSGVLAFLGRAPLLGVGLALLLASRTGRILVLFIGGWFAAYVSALPGAAYHNDHRYLYLLLPLGIAGFCLAWCAVQSRGRRALGVMLALTAVAACMGVPRTWRLYTRDLALTAQELLPAAAFVRAHIPPTEPLLVHDVGFISDAVSNPLVDIVGLKDPQAATLHHEITWARCGGGRALVIDRLARERHARYFVVFAIWDRIFHLTRDLRALGWTLEPLRAPGVAYQVYRLSPSVGGGPP